MTEDVIKWQSDQRTSAQSYTFYIFIKFSYNLYHFHPGRVHDPHGSDFNFKQLSMNSTVYDCKQRGFSICFRFQDFRPLCVGAIPMCDGSLVPDVGKLISNDAWKQNKYVHTAQCGVYGNLYTWRVYRVTKNFLRRHSIVRNRSLEPYDSDAVLHFIII